MATYKLKTNESWKRILYANWNPSFKMH